MQVLGEAGVDQHHHQTHEARAQLLTGDLGGDSSVDHEEEVTGAIAVDGVSAPLPRH